MSRALLVGLLALCTTTRAARADAIDDAADAVRGTATRVRRQFVIGPQVGGFVGYDVDGGAMLHGVGFGLALYRFAVPTILDLRERVVAEIRARVKERVAAIVAGGGVEPADLTEIVREVAAEVKAELTGAPPPRHTLERPLVGAVLEGAVFTSDGGGFQTRLVVSKGVSKASVGLSLAVQRTGGQTRFVPGLELDLRLTPLGVARTPVVELYLRGDVTVAEGTPLAIVGGGRFALDLL